MARDEGGPTRNSPAEDQRYPAVPGILDRWSPASLSPRSPGRDCQLAGALAQDGWHRSIWAGPEGSGTRWLRGSAFSRQIGGSSHNPPSAKTKALT
uniref:Uncharacterized protein n=1 Tax=Sphaerodactylus townsendi TaxID=933632 RepID=A0ACB8EMM2_9SAUR